jgi:L-rhamnose-H+ transport protein
VTPNPALGVLFHWLGGLAAGSFYVPFRSVKRWSWETYWLVGGVFSWIIAPWVLASLLTRRLPEVLGETPVETLFWCVLFGLLWGIGGLTFGLTVRYLGLSLGIAVVMGLCAAFGTLMPPIFNGTFVSQILDITAGRVTLLGIAVCLVGIAIAGAAGVSKERSTSVAQGQSAIKDFNLKKGFLVALVSGVMSSCFAYGLAAGGPIKTLTIRAGTPPLWQGLPVLIVVLAGGFTTNFIWALYLNIRNKTGREYLALEWPLARNYLLCALAGVTWYFQFFFYTMGETKMGAYGFSSWTLHMASIVIFSTLWGVGLKEWKGSGRTAIRLLVLGLIVLVGSTVIVGYGNYLNTLPNAKLAG